MTFAPVDPSEPARGPSRLARPRLYEQLADHLADFIEAQGLVPGDRLPPERRLAKDLGVSRATLSRALVALEVQGRVEVRHGNGAVVRGPASDLELPPLAEAPDTEVRVARHATMSALARQAARHPDSTLRLSLLQDDGTDRTLEDVWSCVLRLTDDTGLLTGIDEALARRLQASVTLPAPPAEAVRRLAAVICRGAVDEVEAACADVLVLP